MTADDRTKLIDHMLECLSTPSRELTKWETDFVESIAEQHGDGRPLSTRQFEILDRIYAEKTS